MVQPSAGSRIPPPPADQPPADQPPPGQPPPGPPSPGRPWWRRYRYPLLGALVVAVVVVVVLLVTLLPGSDSVTKGRPNGSPSGASGTGVPSFPPAGPLTADQKTLLAGRAGYGGEVTGGAGGQVVHVRTNADSGAGSLRDALTGDAPRWIVFDQDTTITLASELTVGSNKTIDGRGHNVKITGPKLNGFELDRSSNVIIESLTLHDFGDVTKTAENDTPDAIHLDGARGVWIDHNDLSMAGDKLIGVSEGSSGLTVSWNHFHDQEQVFQVGNQATADVDARQTVTVHHNFFDHTGYRNPVVSYGRAHIYNNYYLDWRLYAIRSERNAQVLVQNNVFDAGDNRRASLFKVDGNGCNDNHSHCDSRMGAIKVSGNLLLDRANLNANDPGAVSVPGSAYRYDVQKATPSLAQQITKGAGPQS